MAVLTTSPQSLAVSTRRPLQEKEVPKHDDVHASMIKLRTAPPRRRRCSSAPQDGLAARIQNVRENIMSCCSEEDDLTSRIVDTRRAAQESRARMSTEILRLRREINETDRRTRLQGTIKNVLRENRAQIVESLKHGLSDVPENVLEREDECTWEVNTQVAAIRKMAAALDIEELSAMRGVRGGRRNTDLIRKCRAVAIEGRGDIRCLERSFQAHATDGFSLMREKALGLDGRVIALKEKLVLGDEAIREAEETVASRKRAVAKLEGEVRQSRTIFRSTYQRVIKFVDTLTPPATVATTPVVEKTAVPAPIEGGALSRWMKRCGMGAKPAPTPKSTKFQMPMPAPCREVQRGSMPSAPVDCSFACM